MKIVTFKSLLLIGTFILIGSFFIVSNAHALTTGETYTVSVEKLNSNGTVTSGSSSLGISTTATADSDGKLSFSLSGVPNNGSCNFLLININDSAGNTARRSIVPCPDSGGTLPVGVSGLTANQTDALLAALAAAGTDDPILAVFGFAIVRSTATSASELSVMANFANQGITGSGGFIDYLTSNGVTSSQLSTYRKSIVSLLANPTDGYSKLIKDSVDAATTSGELNARGEAASKLLNFLVKAATTAGFSQDRVLEAFNAMGAIVVPMMHSAVESGELSAATAKMIDSSIGGGLQKLKADRDIEKYSAALTVLGASGDDVSNYQTAATTLLNAMTIAFQMFEQVFDGEETQSKVQTAETAHNSIMEAAFDQFMTDTAASDSRITTMISNIDSALGVSTGLSASEFKYYKPDGTSVNWPLTMVIMVDWASNVVAAGGEMTYTRDDTAIPGTVTWLGSCSENYYDKDSCEGAGGTWTAGRRDFGPDGEDIPTSYASIFGIQQDIEILEFTRWANQSEAGEDMGEHETLEKNFSDSVANLAVKIGGTTDGSTGISSALKSAIVTLLKSPQF